MKKRISSMAKTFGVHSFAAAAYRFLLSLKRGWFEFMDMRSSSPQALVLVYHRVADLAADPLQLAVTPAHFAEQLAWLKEHFEVISSPELVKRISSRSLAGNEAVITFDDGYKDNLTNALPIARKAGVPFTIFVTSGILGTALPFPWDKIYGNTRASYLSEADLRELSKDRLVTIGAHTKTHPRLSDLPSYAQKAELSSSKEEIERILGKAVDFLAYPFGDYPDFNAASARATKEAGYAAAFSNVQRMTSEKNDIFRIPRILARDWSREEMEERLGRYTHII